MMYSCFGNLIIAFLTINDMGVWSIEYDSKVPFCTCRFFMHETTVVGRNDRNETLILGFTTTHTCTQIAKVSQPLFLPINVPLSLLEFQSNIFPVNPSPSEIGKDWMDVNKMLKTAPHIVELLLYCYQEVFSDLRGGSQQGQSEELNYQIVILPLKHPYKQLHHCQDFV